MLRRKQKFIGFWTVFQEYKNKYCFSNSASAVYLKAG